MGEAPETKEDRYEMFLRLFRANEERIYLFILTLLPNYAVAEDIMQETMLVMWRKFDQFEPGTSFVSWGMQISRFNVYKYLRENSKSNVVHFNSGVVENILKQQYIFEEKENVYLESLQNCLEKLQGNSRKLVAMRYGDNMKVTDIAVQIGKTAQATYKIMSRIHQQLFQCVEWAIKTEDVLNES